MTYLLVLFAGIVTGAACAVVAFAWCIRSVYGYGVEEDES